MGFGGYGGCGYGGGYGRSYDRNQFDFLQLEISQPSFRTREFRFITGDPGNDCVPSTTCVPWDPIYFTPEGRELLLAGTPGGRGGGGCGGGFALIVVLFILLIIIGASCFGGGFGGGC